MHTTLDSGYGSPNFNMLSQSYNIEYFKYSACIPKKIDRPMIIEIKIDDDIDLAPYLPKGNDCQKLAPEISEMLFNELNNL